MKFVSKKVIKGRIYYYLQFGRHIKNCGPFLPKDLKNRLKGFFFSISQKKAKSLPEQVKKDFRYGSLETLEEAHHWYLLLKNSEVYAMDNEHFWNWFTALFTYNSNRAEGSKVTRPQVEEFIFSKRRKPKTRTDREIANSFAALNYALSGQMRWNLKHIKKIHALLLDGLDDPIIIGKWKNENNTAPGNQPTTHFKEVPKRMKELMDWLHKGFKQKVYPPKLALEFYVKFEAIHPFLDGNGRVGRILLNALLHRASYMPVIFFTRNHEMHCEGITQALQGRPAKLHKHFMMQNKLTLEEMTKIIKEA